MDPGPHQYRRSGCGGADGAHGGRWRTGLLSTSDQLFSEYEQMLFTKAVSVAESFGKHISLLVVPAGDIFAALVQTANSLEAAAVVSGLSSKMSAHEQAYRVGQAWEALPEPKKQITFYVVSQWRGGVVPHWPACTITASR